MISRETQSTSTAQGLVFRHPSTICRIEVSPSATCHSGNNLATAPHDHKRRLEVLPSYDLPLERQAHCDLERRSKRLATRATTLRLLPMTTSAALRYHPRTTCRSGDSLATAPYDQAPSLRYHPRRLAVKAHTLQLKPQPFNVSAVLPGGHLVSPLHLDCASSVVRFQDSAHTGQPTNSGRSCRFPPTGKSFGIGRNESLVTTVRLQLAASTVQPTHLSRPREFQRIHQLPTSGEPLRPRRPI